MLKRECLRLYFPVAIFFTLLSAVSLAQTATITHDAAGKKITFGNGKLKLSLNYDHQANISELVVNGQTVIRNGTGIYSQIRTNDASYSTLRLAQDPAVTVTNNSIAITGITYGDSTVLISETWTFNIADSAIEFTIDRTLSRSITAEKVSLPVFIFQDTATWDGAYQDYGGIAWFYLFNKKLDTYGVHSSSSRFWNSATGNGLAVSVDAPGSQVAMDYSRTATGQLAYTIALAKSALVPRFDSGTQRRMFIRDSTDIWAPFTMDAGESSQRITLSYFDFEEQYGRGKLAGINGAQVSAVLNTIARIGVIGKEHFGGNSWHTPYGPICLHEQYIAQMGLAINDPAYLKGYQQCLDYYRDNAVKPDGRVWSRWAYSNEDAMPGEINNKGFYEAQWGYLLDANPDFVTNVADLYDQTGDLSWVKTHRQTCEQALDWIIKRDGNNNGLVEMMTDSHTQKKGSDWLDIIWASYENAFVNAKLYHALVLWAAIEKQLGNTDKQEYYNRFALQLKASFNKPVSQGGFWDDERKCYIHWRDKDGSAHGSNMVTPVNFMAIAYGICDDELRTKSILDNIEIQMQKEKLFFWPVCMYTYGPGEGNDWQFPFPNYENGDLFLSWGAVAVKAYATYRPGLAIKYVKKVLAQYAKDGLAFQRYGRTRQDGLGDDILSGNSLSVVGLYQAIYGINPLYNRFYLNPHITKKLAGSRIRYQFRGRQLMIGLKMNDYSVSCNQFKISSKTDFGFYNTDSSLSYFKGSSDHASIKATMTGGTGVDLDIKEWGAEKASWTQTFKDGETKKIVYQLNDLKPGADYIISINKKVFQEVKSTGDGSLEFGYESSKQSDKILVTGK